VEAAARAALAAAHLAPHGQVLAWTWPAGDPDTPAHRLAHAAVELLTSEDDLGVLHCCAECRWLFLDRSRGAGRRAPPAGQVAAAAGPARGPARP